MAKGAKTPWLAWVAIVVLLLVLLSRTSKGSSAPVTSAYVPGAPGPGPYSPNLDAIGPVYGPPAPGAAWTPDAPTTNYVETSSGSAPFSSSNPLNPYAGA